MPKQNPDNPNIPPDDENELDALHLLERLERLGSVKAVQEELDWSEKTLQNRLKALRDRYNNNLYNGIGFVGVEGLTDKGKELCEDYKEYIQGKKNLREMVARFFQTNNQSEYPSNPEDEDCTGGKG